MPIEIEAKLKVDSHDPTRQRLRTIGAAPLGTWLETNTFFDGEDRSLLAADRGLRLRSARDVNTKTTTYTLTYKGPRMHGPLKSREEQEVIVGGAPETIALLGCLGYGPVISFEKRRESWKLESCRVELDELPFLGYFVEIEGSSEKAVMRVREQLGLCLLYTSDAADE